MADREKVIRWLRNCDGHTIFTGHGCEKCPYFEDGNISGEECVERLHLDALELLKEHEPVKPIVSVDTWICSKCGHTLESQELIDGEENPQVLVHEQYEYCPCCGRAVKWA